MALGVSTRDIERGLGDVGRDDVRAAELARQRDGEAAAAGADVDYQSPAARPPPNAASASSTINSVSGRGMSTSRVTSNDSPQNSRSPRM